MFGRKARQIANQAVMIANARKENREHLSSIVAKNKQIIALNDAIQEHTQEIEDLRAKVTRAEGSADAAIQAGGVISGQLHAARDELALKTATIAKLNLDIDDLKATDERLSDALRQARAEIAHLQAVMGEKAVKAPSGAGDITVIGPECFASLDGEVISWQGRNYIPQEHPNSLLPHRVQEQKQAKPGAKPGATPGRRPQGVPPKVAPPPPQPKATPPLASGGWVKGPQEYPVQISDPEDPKS